MSPNASPSTIFLGLDVHKESITIAVLPSDAPAPTRVDKLSYDLRKLRRCLERLGPTATIRACYEASGAGYVLQRALTEWGIVCTVIAPSLIPTKPGVQRKHDKYDASQPRGYFAWVNSPPCTYRRKPRSAFAISCAVARRFSARSSSRATIS